MASAEHNNHDQVVDHVSRVIDQMGIDPKDSIASVARDLISSSAPVFFGDEVTRALESGFSATPNDPEADFMAMRYKDSLDGEKGQIAVISAVQEIAQRAMQLIPAERDVNGIRAHIAGRVIQFDMVLLRMRESAGKPSERTPELERQLFVQSVIRRLELSRNRGELVTGFTSDPTYEGEPKIHIREKGNPFTLETTAERTEFEQKYNVDVAALGDLKQYESEDHEQAYVFVREAEGDLPSYEFRVRKISKGDEVQYLGTIKCGEGKARQEFEFSMNKELYETFLENKQEGSEVLHKTRYFIEQNPESTITVDELIMDDGATDYSAEAEFTTREGMEAFEKRDWMTGQRTGKKYSMRSIAFNGAPWLYEGITA